MIWDIFKSNRDISWEIFIQESIVKPPVLASLDSSAYLRITELLLNTLINKISIEKRAVDINNSTSTGKLDICNYIFPSPLNENLVNINYTTSLLNS